MECPKCKEEENLHYNLDYSKKELPIIDILCNECGELFECKEEEK
jgi:transcription elongation factor Elf1